MGCCLQQAGKGCLNSSSLIVYSISSRQWLRYCKASRLLHSKSVAAFFLSPPPVSPLFSLNSVSVSHGLAVSLNRSLSPSFFSFWSASQTPPDFSLSRVGGGGGGGGQEETRVPTFGENSSLVKKKWVQCASQVWSTVGSAYKWKQPVKGRFTL